MLGAEVPQAETPMRLAEQKEKYYVIPWSNKKILLVTFFGDALSTSSASSSGGDGVTFFSRSPVSADKTICNNPRFIFPLQLRIIVFGDKHLLKSKSINWLLFPFRGIRNLIVENKLRNNLPKLGAETTPPQSTRHRSMRFRLMQILYTYFEFLLQWTRIFNDPVRVSESTYIA